jgi:diguanylate cyclase (GGDEF)-like protein
MGLEEGVSGRNFVCSDKKGVLLIRMFKIPRRPLSFFLGTIVLLCASGLLPGAQESLRFRRYDIEKGLSQNSVYFIVQDRRGFMWFATQDGLNRFDGYAFKVFRPDLDDRFSLSNGYVTALAEDDQGYLWVGTDSGGLNRFDPATEKFSRFGHSPGKPKSLSGSSISSLLVDRKGKLWVGTSDGLDQYVPGSGAFLHFKNAPHDPNSLSRDTVTVLYEGPGETLWVGTQEGGLNRLDSASGRFTRFLPEATVHAVLDDGGLLWVGTEDGLVRLDPGSGKMDVFRNSPVLPGSLAHNEVTALLKDQNQDIWVGTRGGLDRFDRSAGAFVHFKNDLSDLTSLSGDAVLSLGRDRCGGVWIGTNGGGLSRLDRVSMPFTHLSDRSTARNRKNRNQIWAIMEDETGAMWIGTEAGLHIVNRRTGQRFDYENDPARPGSLSQNTVRAVIKDRRGSVWVGTEEAGLNRLDPGARDFVHYRYDPRNPGSLSSDAVRFLLEGHGGELWVATMGGGLNRYDRSTNRFTRYRHDARDASSLGADRVYSLCQDRAGFLWIATWGGGLDRLDPSTGRFTHFRHTSTDPSSLSDNNVLSVMEDRAGSLWVGTRGGGLCQLKPADRGKGKFTVLSEKNGLPNNQIYAILEDEAGSLWLSHNSGLSRYDPVTGRVKTFSLNNGLQSLEFNGNARFRSSSGEMFFGGINGLNAFFPGQIKDNPYSPPAAITDLQVFDRHVPIGPGPDGRTILERSIVLNPPVRLSYKDTMITLGFAALHYAAPENNQYAYMLEGFDENWNVVGDRRLATYTNLPPGRYVFRVRASNNDGLWNNEGASLTIVIMPPYWKTLWFQLLAVLAVMGILAGAVGRRVRRQAQSRRQLEAKVAERTAELVATNRRIQEEVAERQRLLRELELLSVTDELTGLYNRRGFQTFGSELLKMGRRINAQAFLIYIDFDKLKSINDSLGHSEGDLALRDLAAILRRTFRETDLLARVGGDEFAVLGILDKGCSVDILTARLQRGVRDHNSRRDDPRLISLSIGAVAMPVASALSIDDFLHAGDEAMYEQKRLKN